MLSVLISGLFVVISAVLLVASMTIPGASEWDVVGSRLVPQLFAAGLGICSLVIFVMSVKNPAKLADECRAFISGGAKKYGVIVMVFAALLVFIAGVKFIGFYVSSGAFLLFLMWYLNGRRFNVPLIVLSVASPVVLYFVFEKGLKVIMPSGILF